MIFSGVEDLRDPFVVRQAEHYYMYGTGIHNCKQPWEDTEWTCYVNESGKLDGPWERMEKPLFKHPEGAVKNLWAPEVHRYRGSYYMIASYYWEKTKAVFFPLKEENDTLVIIGKEGTL